MFPRKCNNQKFLLGRFGNPLHGVPIPKTSHFVESVLDFQDACFLGCQVTILPVGQILPFGMASNFASEGDAGFSLPFFSVPKVNLFVKCSMMNLLGFPDFLYI